MKKPKVVIIGVGTQAQNAALTTAINKASIVCGCSPEREINILNRIFNKPEPLVFEFSNRMIDNYYPLMVQGVHQEKKKGFRQPSMLGRLQQRNLDKGI